MEALYLWQHRKGNIVTRSHRKCARWNSFPEDKMQVETNEIAPRAQVTSLTMSQEEVFLLSLYCLRTRTSKVMKALKNRDAEQKS